MTEKHQSCSIPSLPDTVKCVVVTGPTASGKTALGVALARCFDGEIISADSRQIYRGMDIGTGKDLDEYRDGGQPVSYHLIDVVGPNEEYDLYQYVRAARKAIRDITVRGKLPVIVGGTPLYVNALLADYDLQGGAPDQDLRSRLNEHSDGELIAELGRLAPDLLQRTDTSQRRRIVRAVEIALSRTPSDASEQLSLLPLVLAPYYPRREIHERIAARLDTRLRNGMIEEVQRLHNNGISWQRLDFLGLEYRYIARHLQGDMSLTEMREVLLARIRRLCKSQDVWFRKMEREGTDIYWIPRGSFSAAAALVDAFLRGVSLPQPSFRLNDILYGPRSQ